MKPKEKLLNQIIDEANGEGKFNVSIDLVDGNFIFSVNGKMKLQDLIRLKKEMDSANTWDSPNDFGLAN